MILPLRGVFIIGVVGFVILFCFHLPLYSLDVYHLLFFDLVNLFIIF